MLTQVLAFEAASKCLECDNLDAAILIARQLSIVNPFCGDILDRAISTYDFLEKTWEFQRDPNKSVLSELISDAKLELNSITHARRILSEPCEYGDDDLPF